jgi:hypothetical protein
MNKRTIGSDGMSFLRLEAGYVLLYQKINTDIRSESEIFNLTEKI